MAHCERDKTYAYDRLKYPMIREDFVETPDGKNRNTENRGKSGYRRASWDEALGLVAREIKRLQKTYGKETITAMYLLPPFLGAGVAIRFLCSSASSP